MPGKLDIAPSEAARPRWGLFAVSALAAFLLVATALWSWVGAREAASHLTEARALTLTTSVSRALRNREDAVQPTLDGLLDDHFDDGLRYVALIRGERLVGAAGEPATAVEPKDIARRPRLEEIGDRVRAVGPLRERRPGARRRAGRQGPAADSAVVAPARRDTSGLPAILVLEVEPTVARALQTRALTGLALALAVAALLMGAAAAFWRLGRRA